MDLRRLALGGFALSMAAIVTPDPSFAGTLAVSVKGGVFSSEPTLAQPVFHGHARKGTSFYCYPRNYWWFYRPYTTAADGHARCMPYFHYPPQAYRGRRGPDGVK